MPGGNCLYPPRHLRVGENDPGHGESSCPSAINKPARPCLLPHDGVDGVVAALPRAGESQLGLRL